MLALLCFGVSLVNAEVPTITERFAIVNGLRLHYLVAGKGDPVILLHGYAQTSHMWRPLIKELAKTHLVLAPDLRGFGDSEKAESGYDKKTMAKRILGEYPDEYLKMLEFIDRFPDLPETPAQFQERCGQVALKCFWNETHDPAPVESGPMPREIVPAKDAADTVADGDFLSVS